MGILIISEDKGAKALKKNSGIALQLKNPFYPPHVYRRGTPQNTDQYDRNAHRQFGKYLTTIESAELKGNSVSLVSGVGLNFTHNNRPDYKNYQTRNGGLDKKAIFLAMKRIYSEMIAAAEASGADVFIVPVLSTGYYGEAAPFLSKINGEFSSKKAFEKAKEEYSTTRSKNPIVIVEAVYDRRAGRDSVNDALRYIAKGKKVAIGIAGADNSGTGNPKFPHPGRYLPQEEAVRVECEFDLRYGNDGNESYREKHLIVVNLQIKNKTALEKSILASAEKILKNEKQNSGKHSPEYSLTLKMLANDLRRIATLTRLKNSKALLDRANEYSKQLTPDISMAAPAAFSKNDFHVAQDRKQMDRFDTSYGVCQHVPNLLQGYPSASTAGGINESSLRRRPDEPAMIRLFEDVEDVEDVKDDKVATDGDMFFGTDNLDDLFCEDIRTSVSNDHPESDRQPEDTLDQHGDGVDISTASAQNRLPMSFQSFTSQLLVALDNFKIEVGGKHLFEKVEIRTMKALAEAADKNNAPEATIRSCKDIIIALNNCLYKYVKELCSNYIQSQLINEQRTGQHEQSVQSPVDPKQIDELLERNGTVINNKQTFSLYQLQARYAMKVFEKRMRAAARSSFVSFRSDQVTRIYSLAAAAAKYSTKSRIVYTDDKGNECSIEDTYFQMIERMQSSSYSPVSSRFNNQKIPQLPDSKIPQAKPNSYCDQLYNALNAYYDSQQVVWKKTELDYLCQFAVDADNNPNDRVLIAGCKDIINMLERGINPLIVRKSPATADRRISQYRGNIPSSSQSVEVEVPTVVSTKPRYNKPQPKDDSMFVTKFLSHATQQLENDRKRYAKYTCCLSYCFGIGKSYWQGKKPETVTVDSIIKHAMGLNAKTMTGARTRKILEKYFKISIQFTGIVDEQDSDSVQRSQDALNLHRQEIRNWIEDRQSKDSKRESNRLTVHRY